MSPEFELYMTTLFLLTGAAPELGAVTIVPLVYPAFPQNHPPA